MISKSKPPIDVTLKKSESGIWKVPHTPKLPYKPWQRLWIVTGIIYLLILAGSYHLITPNRESIERQMVFSVTEEVSRYDGMAFTGESPHKIFEIARSHGYAAWIIQLRSKYRFGPEGNAGFDRIEKEYREAISDLPVKRTIGVMLCVVAWLAPMAAFYAIGFAMDWIKRGVRGSHE
jgi:hypothetical protein